MKALKLNGILILILLLHNGNAFAQKKKLESILKTSDPQALIDSLMEGFEAYLDSISEPKSFFNASVGVGTGIFSFENKNSVYYSNEKKLIFSPNIGYYHKSGFGITGSAYSLLDEGTFNFYQFAVTPSYDYIKRKFSAGVAYSRFFQKDSLDFYSTPIQNEVFAYFTYKDAFVKPGITIAYGWGSKTSFEERKVEILKKRKKRRGSYFLTEKVHESVSDLSVILSLKKDFNWYDVLFESDYISFTPVVLLNSGTQNYGFNISYTHQLPANIKINSLPANSSISDQSTFAPQSVGMIFRCSYIKGPLMLQPQVFCDYFLPESDEPFNTAFSFTAGLTF
jgi:hypothetical protein